MIIIAHFFNIIIVGREIFLNHFFYYVMIVRMQ